MPTACMISRVSVSARRLLPSSVLKRTEEPIARSYSLRNAASAFWAWVVAWAVLRSAVCWALTSATAVLMPSLRPATVALYSSVRRAEPCASSRTALSASRLLCRLALQGLEALDRPLLGGERLERVRGLQSTFIEVALHDISDPVLRLSE